MVANGLPADVPAVFRARPRKKSNDNRMKGLKLTSDFEGGNCCDGCQLLVGPTVDADGSIIVKDESAIFAEVHKDLVVMSPWERIASIHSWNQVGWKEMQKQNWAGASQSYLRALAYAQALANHGTLAASCASWAPAERQQQEVQRLCGEVYVGLALLQLCLERAEVDVPEYAKATLLQKAVESADRALELDPNSAQAHTRRGLAKLRLAQLPSFDNKRQELFYLGHSAIQNALQIYVTNRQSLPDELQEAMVESAALAETRTSALSKTAAPNDNPSAVSGIAAPMENLSNCRLM